MPDIEFFAESPEAVGLDPARVDDLLTRAEREVREGLLPSSQIAIARDGKIAAMRTSLRRREPQDHHLVLRSTPLG